MISGADEDGRVMVEFSEPVGGRRVKMLTPDEINGMLYKEETSESPANAEEAMAEETEPPTASQEESGESALERIPKDAQTGEPQYTQTDAPTAWDAIVEQTEGDEDMARSVVDSTVRDKEAALKKLESSNPKPGATVAEKIAAAKEHKAAIEAARQELEQWKAIAEVENSRKAEAEAKAKAEEEEATAKSKSEEAKSKSEEKNGVDDAKIEAVSEALSKGNEKAEQLVQGLTSRELSKLRSKVKASPMLENEWLHRVRTRGDVSLHDWMLENQYVEPVKRVSGTFKITDYIAPKDSPYAERIGGVYHDKSGFAVATDGIILVADKGSYDPKLKGKIIGKDGAAMENKFPDWQKAISTAKETKSSRIDVEDLHRFVAGVLRANKRAYISLRFPDGTVGVSKQTD